jgi:ABC-type glutathione transport system ATPase component
MTAGLILEADVTVDYPGKPKAIDRAALTVGAGETVGLIGQSGSGKSTLAMAILGLLDGARVSGVVRLGGRDLLGLREREWRRIRGREVALVPQSPAAAMNPALRIEDHLAEAWRAHGATPWSRERERVRALLAEIGLPAGGDFLRRYPSGISVGQAQRVLIAAAVLHRPSLVVADEPTSALDAHTSSEVLALLDRLNRTMGMAVLFISHDLRSVAALCDRALIIESGRVVESGQTRTILECPSHPAAKRLVDSVRLLDRGLRAGTAAPEGTSEVAKLAGSIGEEKAVNERV